MIFWSTLPRKASCKMQATQHKEAIWKKNLKKVFSYFIQRAKQTNKSRHRPSGFSRHTISDSPYQFVLRSWEHSSLPERKTWSCSSPLSGFRCGSKVTNSCILAIWSGADSILGPRTCMGLIVGFCLLRDWKNVGVTFSKFYELLFNPSKYLHETW